MLRAKVYNLDGTVAQELDLPKQVFGQRVDRVLLHRVIVARDFSRRPSGAHSKTRAEVRGGGRKPWRQKGTGRARQGSIRAPQWKGGGVVFGPRAERNWERKVNEKIIRKAFAVAWSGKWKSDHIAWLNAFILEEPKTKQFVTVMRQAKEKVAPMRQAVWGNRGKLGILLVMASPHESVMRAGRNVPGVKIARAQDVAVEDVVGYKTILTTPDVIPVLLKRCATQKK